MFVNAVFQHRVRLSMQEVGGNVRSAVEHRAMAMLEGVCSENGFVKPGTVRLLDMGQGCLSSADMCRYVNFDCTVRAEVYNPPPKFRHTAFVRSMNAFGALLEAGYWDERGVLVPVIEVVVVRDPVVSANEAPLDGLEVGDSAVVEILSSRFDLRDTHMTGYGRLVKSLGSAGGEGAPSLFAAAPVSVADGEVGDGAEGSVASSIQDADEEAADIDTEDEDEEEEEAEEDVAGAVVDGASDSEEENVNLYGGAEEADQGGGSDSGESDAED
jgi:hypothetical protein